MRMGKFALVGLSGLAVNEALLFLLTEYAGLYYLVSGIAAVETSIITNFTLNERWTFADKHKGSAEKRFAKYNLVSLAGLTINVTLLFCFTGFLGIYYLVSNAFAIVAVFFWNYFVNRVLTWKDEAPALDKPAMSANPLVSIIIPTYNEAENIAALVPRIFGSMDKRGLKSEVVIVDDNSPDGTGEIAEGMKAKFDVKVIHRRGKLGLSTAVIEGIEKAEGEIVGVMDADLSHSPELIPELVEPIARNEFDVTVGSRYSNGWGITDWPVKRRMISKGATMLARPLTGVKDPMSGFFFFNRRVIEGKDLNPSGYKIGLEIIVKSGSNIKEIPYTFIDRKHGKSKLGLKEDVQYLIHLARLYWYKANA